MPLKGWDAPDVFNKVSVSFFLPSVVTITKYNLKLSLLTDPTNTLMQMADHPLPEMMRLSLSDLALRIKIMKVKLGSSIEDVLSRAVDPLCPSMFNELFQR
jgi:spore maturation protein SpmA